MGHIIFETDTPAARAFDLILLIAILLSILLVLLESVGSIRLRVGPQLRMLEWAFTIIFTIEYALRIYSARRRQRYLTSFYGVIDLLAILPTYLTLFFTGTQYFAVLRALRLLRVFRVLKLSRYLGEASVLAQALRASRAKIVVFVTTVLTLVLIIGAVMYLVEGPENGYTSIPIAMYWAIVTLTTVGYGDVSPGTPLGRFLASAVMIMGYGIIAVPTGIVTTELTRASIGRERRTAPCPSCGTQHHELDATFCRRCGTALEAEASDGARGPAEPTRRPGRAPGPGEPGPGSAGR